MSEGKTGGTIRGVVGEIKWHYYTAASINGYAVTYHHQDKRWSLRATVALSDAFKMAQRPLIFVAPTQKGDFRWPINSLEILDGKLTARLGAPLP